MAGRVPTSEVDVKLLALYVPPAGHRPERRAIEVEAEDLREGLEQLARLAPSGWLRILLEAS